MLNLPVPENPSPDPAVIPGAPACSFACRKGDSFPILDIPSTPFSGPLDPALGDNVAANCARLVNGLEPRSCNCSFASAASASVAMWNEVGFDNGRRVSNGEVECIR